MKILEAQTFGLVQPREVIGRGRFGVVYGGLHRRLGELCALKVIPAPDADGAFLDRCREAAQRMAGLCHPNIVEILDLGEANGSFYLAMTAIEGISLQEMI